MGGRKPRMVVGPGERKCVTGSSGGEGVALISSCLLLSFLSVLR